MNLDAIPTELRERPQWVVWRLEERDGRSTKVPYRPSDPARMASTTDPSTWATIEQALAAVDVADGLGYVFAHDDPFSGVDLDACIDQAGELHPDAAAIVAELDSYTEKSVSGRGVHVIARAELNGSRNRTTRTGWGGDFEVYSTERYFVVSGAHLRGTPTTIKPRQVELDKVLERIFPAAACAIAHVGATLDVEDEDLLERARVARNGAGFDRLYRGDTTKHGSHSEADLALCGMLAFWSGPDPVRIDRLFRGSGLMREKWDTRRGDTTYGAQTIEAALAGRTEFYGAEPARIAASAAFGREPQRQVKSANDYLRSDLGNAELFADRHAARLRHVKERRLWLVWESGRWRPDTTGAAERAAKELARERLRAAADVDDEDKRKKAVVWAMTSQSDARIRAALSLATTEPAVVLRAEDLDRDPFLLACANGVLDLRTGRLRSPDPGDLISLGSDVGYDRAAPCPRWQQFLEEIFPGDSELPGYVQRLVGYCLTGDTREQIVAVLHGAGGNGKDTFIRPIMRLLGDLAQTAPFQTFARSRDDRSARNDLARLHRSRLVVASESAEGRQLDEAVVKLVSGGGRVAARFLYAEFFEYVPRYKVFLVTNHRPRVDGDDDAIWRRLRLIPFEESFVGREDKTLDATLELELPGILAWAVEGCLAWQREGLGLPAAVERATRDYRQDEDVLGAFIAERCTLSGQVEPGELRAAYAEFCRALGEEPLAANVLGKRLSRRSITRAAQGRGAYVGIELKA